jgi:holo-[acyl-carrier protein] synthase
VNNLYFIGTDIIEIARIKKAVAHRGGDFLRRVYTDREIKQYRKKPSSLAARFAAKEAVMKALGQGMFAIGWRDIEVLSEPDGRPAVCLRGRAELRANQLGIKTLVLSLSHSRDYALAVALATTEDKEAT